MKCLGSQSVLACGLILLLSIAQGALGVGVLPVTNRPHNDRCDKADSVGDKSNLAFDTTRATFDGPGHCMVSPNVWYCYTAPCTGTATISLAGSSFDTKLAVYNGCGCYPDSSDLIECNDDYHAQQSQVTFDVTAGNEYLIEVGGYDAAAKGQGLISIDCDTDTLPSPPNPWVYNDDCSEARSVGEVTDLSFDTDGATFDGPGLCMEGPNIWYRYTASCTDNVTISLLGSSYDTMLAVYDGSGCYPTSSKLIECNDDASSGFHSRITFAASAGRQYLIEIGGFDSETGEGLLSIACGDDSDPPSDQKAANDDCDNPQSVGDVTGLEFDTRDGTFDGRGLCMTGPNLWYCYTASCTGDVTVSLDGSDYDTMLAVYDGCNCYLASNELIDCDDDSGSGSASEITFSAIAGRRYLIEVGGYGSETGQGVLSISCFGLTTPGESDLGDAPDSSNNFGNSMTAYPKGVFTGPRAHYPTVFDDGSGAGPYGPVHLNSLAVAYLGRNITRESEADSGSDQDGVNNIRPGSNWPDEDGGDDGVVFPLSLPKCGWATFDYDLTVVNPGTDLWVNVWLDFNRDGDWDDTSTCLGGPAPEWAVQNQFLFNLPAGLSRITTPAFLSSHPKDGPAEIWMRITLSEKPWKGGSNPGQLGNGGSGPYAKYEIGETEDYYFAPEMPAKADCQLCEDFNGDGVIDINDLAAFVAEWLTTCP
ncbi:MAG: GEVED domain-containing protein [Planctomycetota bacterium]|jgi:hypothetical protein